MMSPSVKLWISLALLTAMILLFVVINKPGNFPIRKVVTLGDYSQVSRDKVVAAADEYLGENFFFINKLNVRAKVESLPWVYSAQVARVWPDKLIVKVRSQEAVARWGNSGFVNQHAELFYAESKLDKKQLPELSGPNKSEVLVLDTYKQMESWLLPHGMSISKLNLNDRGSWAIEIDRRLKVSLGRRTFMSRFKRFVMTYQKIKTVKGKEVAHIDMRYSQGFSVKWRDQVKSNLKVRENNNV